MCVRMDVLVGAVLCDKRSCTTFQTLLVKRHNVPGRDYLSTTVRLKTLCAVSCVQQLSGLSNTNACQTVVNESEYSQYPSKENLQFDCNETKQSL